MVSHTETVFGIFSSVTKFSKPMGLVVSIMVEALLGVDPVLPLEGSITLENFFGNNRVYIHTASVCVNFSRQFSQI